MLLWALMWIFTEDPDSHALVLDRLLGWSYALGSFYLLFYGAVPRWLAQRRYGRLGAVGLALCLVGGWVMYWQNRLYPPSTYQYMADFEAYGVFAIFLSNRYFFYAVCNGLVFKLAGPGVLKIALTLYQRQLDRQRAEQLTRQLHLDALLGQVSPHFLFNTLNNLYGLLLHDDPRAPAITRQLAALLRYTDELAGQPWVTLRAEANFMEDFLALTRLRYGQSVRLTSQWHLAEAEAAHIPPLLLLPLVENAVKHGLSQSLGKAWVRVYAEVQAQELRVTVTNSRTEVLHPSSAPPGGLGLATLRERLTLLFPEVEPLTLVVTATTFEATLRLTLRGADSEPSTVLVAAALRLPELA